MTGFREVHSKSAHTRLCSLVIFLQALYDCRLRTGLILAGDYRKIVISSTLVSSSQGQEQRG